MTIITYLLCLAAGLLGQAFHILIKISKLEKLARAANTRFLINEYLNDDKWPIMLNAAAILIEIFLLDEIVKPYPTMIDYLKFTFMAFGYMGSSLLSAGLSKAEEKVKTIIDRKTDIADGK